MVHILKNICDYLTYKLCKHDILNPPDAQHYKFGLHHIDKLFQSHDPHLSEWTQMPASTMNRDVYHTIVNMAVRVMDTYRYSLSVAIQEGQHSQSSWYVQAKIQL